MVKAFQRRCEYGNKHMFDSLSQFYNRESVTVKMKKFPVFDTPLRKPGAAQNQERLSGCVRTGATTIRTKLDEIIDRDIMKLIIVSQSDGTGDRKQAGRRIVDFQSPI